VNGNGCLKCCFNRFMTSRGGGALGSGVQVPRILPRRRTFSGEWLNVAKRVVKSRTETVFILQFWPISAVNASRPKSRPATLARAGPAGPVLGGTEAGPWGGAEGEDQGLAHPSEAKHIANRGANCVSPVPADAASAARELSRFEGMEHGAVGKRLPVHPPGAFQPHFKGMGHATLALAGTEQHVDDSHPGTAVRRRSPNDRMRLQASTFNLFTMGISRNGCQESSASGSHASRGRHWRALPAARPAQRDAEGRRHPARQRSKKSPKDLPRGQPERSQVHSATSPCSH